MNTRTSSTTYFAVGIIFMALESIGADWPAIIVKGIIIPVLIFMYIKLIKGDVNKFHRLIITALFFSWMGDVTLQLQNKFEIFFMIGLGCFLVAQVLYLVAFFSTTGENVLFFKKVYLILPVVGYGTVLIYIMYNGLGDMRIPVIIYAAVILTMLTAAMNREKKVNRQSYILVLVGAILFVLSDSMIALNKFAHPFVLARIAIMTTYIIAQYLIAIGCLKQSGVELNLIRRTI